MNVNTIFCLILVAVSLCLGFLEMSVGRGIWFLLAGMYLYHAQHFANRS